jgi:hypothetical protein
MAALEKVIMKIQVRTAQKWLIAEWLVLGGVLFLILFIQWMSNKYGDKWQEAANWFGATVAPTLTLMLGGFITKLAGQSAENETIEGFPFFVALGSCFFYLAACIAVILASPFSETPPLALMKASEQWLHIIQGVSGLTLGWFFVSKQEHQT